MLAQSFNYHKTRSVPSRRIVPLGVMLAILLTLVLSLGTGARPVSASGDAWVSADPLNLRNGPGLWADVIDKMWSDEYVAVLDGPTDDGWYEISYQGTVGWAFGSYLAMGGGMGWSGEPVGYSGGASDYSAERWVDIDRSSETVTLYEGNTPIASYWAAMGYDDSSYGFYSTAIGTYYVFSKNADLTWTDWGQVYIKYWVGYDPERSNGFHSYSMDAYGNVLPNGAGKTGGCVALSPGAAEVVYDFTSIGTRIEIHW